MFKMKRKKLFELKKLTANRAGAMLLMIMHRLKWMLVNWNFQFWHYSHRCCCIPFANFCSFFFRRFFFVLQKCDVHLITMFIGKSVSIRFTQPTKKSNNILDSQKSNNFICWERKKPNQNSVKPHNPQIKFDQRNKLFAFIYLLFLPFLSQFLLLLYFKCIMNSV